MDDWPDSPIDARTRLAAYDGGTTSQSLPASRLERVLGRPAEEWTADDLVGLVRDRGIRLVSLMHIGSDGWLKTLDFVPRDAGHLRDILAGGERADGSSVLAGMGIAAGASDIVLRPRISTAFVNPFSPLPTLTLLCGHRGRDGRPLPQSPDTMIWRAYERCHQEAGVDLWALGEIEYFIGRRWTESDRYGADDHGYHATAPVAFGEALRRQAMVVLAEIGVAMKYGHSEVGYVKASGPDEIVWEQHEIELALRPLPRAAYAASLTHWVLRNLAQDMKLDCTFDPIIGRGHAGNGMHVHMCPKVDGEPASGFDAEGGLLEPAQWLIAGLTQIGDALMAFGNRSDDSFVRLSQGKEAPAGVTWGQFDRSALIRIPVVVETPNGRAVSPPTIEFRLPDGSAHPHLLLAGVAQALVFGMQLADRAAILERTAAGKALGTIPTSRAEVAAAVRERREALVAGGVFPASFVDALASEPGDPA